MRCHYDDILENFLDVSSAQNSKKSERVTRASFVDYVSSATSWLIICDLVYLQVSEVVTRPGLHSSSSTLASVAREASVRQGPTVCKLTFNFFLIFIFICHQLCFFLHKTPIPPSFDPNVEPRCQEQSDPRQREPGARRTASERHWARAEIQVFRWDKSGSISIKLRWDKSESIIVKLRWDN